MESSRHPSRLGRYQVERLLAEGGMAELFLARLPGIEGFDKRVVVKRVLPGLARDREFVDMFLGEARLAATLHHQNVVQVHDIGHDDHGFFFAMEYLHGVDVGEMMRAVTAGGGELPLDIALEIARGACAGLHYAHERRGPDGAPLGIVHRDVSPQNLFVTFDGGVKVLDFGIAKAVQQSANHYTRSGTLRGKLPYMSPEQCQGKAIDRRSDIFSLSVVLWEMTVGARLFGGGGEGDFEILKAIVEREAPRPSLRKPGYPAALEAIVMRGLRTDRADRYNTCDEMQGELEGFMRETGRWATARDVAAYTRESFAERAAQSLRMAAAGERPEPEGEIVPFPGVATRETVDLPRPINVVVREPTATDRPPATPPRRVLGLVAGAIAIAAVTAIAGFWLGARRDASPTSTSTSTPAASAAEPAPPRTVEAAADKPVEDALWFHRDDYLVSADPFKNGRLDHLVVAKMTAAPDDHGVAEFLSATGVESRTGHYWATHLARPSELAIGTLAFCPGGYTARTVETPESKDGAKKVQWFAGRITDVSELGEGRATVADASCAVGAVRVAD